MSLSIPSPFFSLGSPTHAELPPPDPEQATNSGDQDHCSICLQPVEDRTLIPPCSHEFCFDCLSIWTLQSRRCPLCSQPIGPYLIHKIRSRWDYQKHFLPPLRDKDGNESTRPSSSRLPAGERPRRRETRREREWGRRLREENDALERAISRRRWVYRHDLYAKHVASNPYTRYRPHPTPAQFSASQDLQSRAQAFVRRELRVWPSLDVDFLTAFLLSLMKSIDIRSQAAINLLSEFLDVSLPSHSPDNVAETSASSSSSRPGSEIDDSKNKTRNAEHFAHEVYSYLRSPYRDLAVYDGLVQYDTPQDVPPHEIDRGQQSNRWERSRSPSRSRSPRSRSAHRSRSRSRRNPDRNRDSLSPRRHSGRTRPRRTYTDVDFIDVDAPSANQSPKGKANCYAKEEIPRTNGRPSRGRKSVKDKKGVDECIDLTRSPTPRSRSPIFEVEDVNGASSSYPGDGRRQIQYASSEVLTDAMDVGVEEISNERRKDKGKVKENVPDLQDVEEGLGKRRRNSESPRASGIDAVPRRIRPQMNNLRDGVIAYLGHSGRRGGRSTNQSQSSSFQRNSADIEQAGEDSVPSAETTVGSCGLPAQTIMARTRLRLAAMKGALGADVLPSESSTATFTDGNQGLGFSGPREADFLIRTAASTDDRTRTNPTGGVSSDFSMDLRAPSSINKAPRGGNDSPRISGASQNRHEAAVATTNLNGADTTVSVPLCPVNTDLRTRLLLKLEEEKKVASSRLS